MSDELETRLRVLCGDEWHVDPGDEDPELVALMALARRAAAIGAEIEREELAMYAEATGCPLEPHTIRNHALDASYRARGGK